MNGSGLPFQDLPFLLAMGVFFLWPLYPIALVLWLTLGRRRVRPWAPALYALPLAFVVAKLFVPHRLDLWLQAHGLSDPILLSALAAIAAGPLHTILLSLLDATTRERRQPA